MHSLKTEVGRLTTTTEGSPWGRAIIRSTVALLYAHWEGYVKEACQGYLDYVGKRRINMKHLSDTFLVLGLRSTIRAAAKDDSAAMDKLVSLLRDGLDHRSNIERMDVVNTYGNLRFETLCDILKALGLDWTAFSTKEQLIERSLCDARNDIAHGRSQCPSMAATLELHDVVLGMMQTIRGLVSAAAIGEAYRLQEPPQA